MKWLAVLSPLTDFQGNDTGRTLEVVTQDTAVLAVKTPSGWTVKYGPGANCA